MHKVVDTVFVFLHCFPGLESRELKSGHQLEVEIICGPGTDKVSLAFHHRSRPSLDPIRPTLLAEKYVFNLDLSAQRLVRLETEFMHIALPHYIHIPYKVLHGI